VVARYLFLTQTTLPPTARRPAGNSAARIVETLYAQLTATLVIPETEGIAASVVAQPWVMEEGHRPFQLDLRVLEPKYKASS